MAEAVARSALGRRLDIKFLLKNPAPAIDFVLPGLPAGVVGLLVSPGGMGKTMLELQLGILLATGLMARDPLFGTTPDFVAVDTPQRVLMVAAEEPVEVLWARLHAIVRSLNLRDVLPDGLSWGEFLDRLHDNFILYSLGGARRLTLLSPELEATEHAQELSEQAIGARLVIVDPLRQVHLADENPSGPMSALVSVFKKMAQESGAAVLLAHHSSRAASVQGFGEEADALRGSTALKDDTRWQANLAKPSKELLRQFGQANNAGADFVALADAKRNYGPKRPTVLLQRTAGGVLVPVSMPQDAEQGALSRKRTTPRSKA
ncbi:hypothetical protein LPB72_07255 [Hydrogenophaga crassostreae]|uniref:AAA family ATPase n=1 Tax=Hydrogenophaga crassostreae TaxID=1763535 RepID=A0A167IGA3_9BURK|nr:AAA family ATPase [Hydrogenophaga crassostreae]AOW13156.1 hypothetical protein LPB072_10115 [Hydrogenophaga crassostreae]OAD42698.1 hypothetical protein LPB72_07255 [Hydrogenophaga crassostreae]